MVGLVLGFAQVYGPLVCFACGYGVEKQNFHIGWYERMIRSEISGTSLMFPSCLW